MRLFHAAALRPFGLGRYASQAKRTAAIAKGDIDMAIDLSYQAGSLDEIADHLLDKAKEFRERARFSPRRKDQEALLNEAQGIEFAADLLRATTIVER
jgi:hypothetical protein